MSELTAAWDIAQDLLARFFRDPATALAVLIVGYKLGRKMDRADDRQAVLIDALKLNLKASEVAAESLAESAGRLEVAAGKIEHAATSVLGVHSLTQEMMKRLVRQLADDNEGS